MSKKYVDSDGHDHVMCPLIEEYIEDIECIINRDVVDELLKERVMPKNLKNVKDGVRYAISVNGIIIRCVFII